MTSFRSSPEARGLWPVASLFIACVSPDAGRPYDFVITNAKIVDGACNPLYCGDAGIRGDKIATIGDVFVNGVAVWRNGKLTGAAPERALRRPATQGAKGAKGA